MVYWSTSEVRFWRVLVRVLWKVGVRGSMVGLAGIGVFQALVAAYGRTFTHGRPGGRRSTRAAGGGGSSAPPSQPATPTSNAAAQTAATLALRPRAARLIAPRAPSAGLCSSPAPGRRRAPRDRAGSSRAAGRRGGPPPPRRLQVPARAGC